LHDAVTLSFFLLGIDRVKAGKRLGSGRQLKLDEENFATFLATIDLSGTIQKVPGDHQRPEFRKLLFAFSKAQGIELKSDAAYWARYLERGND